MSPAHLLPVDDDDSPLAVQLRFLHLCREFGVLYCALGTITS